MRYVSGFFFGAALLAAYLLLVFVLWIDLRLVLEAANCMYNLLFHPSSVSDFFEGVYSLIPLIGSVLLGITTVYVIRKVRIGFKVERGEGKKYIKPFFSLLFLVGFAALAVIPWVYRDWLTNVSVWILLGIDACYIGTQLKK
jgi:hypothetical protein